MLAEALRISSGLTAIIGGGGKSTLLHDLAVELGKCGRVIVATSTKMRVPDWCPVLLGESLDEVAEALSANPIVCVGSIQEQTGKLDTPHIAFSDLVAQADYVLVEADGAKGLPCKAHASYEPVIPPCANQVVCVVGIDGIGKPIAQTCHRADLYARLADANVDDVVTPSMVVAVLQAEGLHDRVLVNKVETEADWQAAREIARLSEKPVVAGSLWKGALRCLQ